MIEGAEDEGMIAPGKVTNREGDEQEVEEEEEESGRITTKCKHDSRHPSEQKGIEREMTHLFFSEAGPAIESEAGR